MPTAAAPVKQLMTDRVKQRERPMKTKGMVRKRPVRPQDSQRQPPDRHWTAATPPHT